LMRSAAEKADKKSHTIILSSLFLPKVAVSKPSDV